MLSSTAISPAHTSSRTSLVHVIVWKEGREAEGAPDTVSSRTIDALVARSGPSWPCMPFITDEKGEVYLVYAFLALHMALAGLVTGTGGGLSGLAASRGTRSSDWSPLGLRGRVGFL
jgi:hypothetical protein